MFNISNFLHLHLPLRTPLRWPQEGHTMHFGKTKIAKHAVIVVTFDGPLLPGAGRTTNMHKLLCGYDENCPLVSNMQGF